MKTILFATASLFAAGLLVAAALATTARADQIPGSDHVANHAFLSTTFSALADRAAP